MSIADAHRDYWIEAVETSFEEEGISATKEQVEAVAGAMEVSQECFGMSFPAPESSHKSELAEMERKLTREKEKEICEDCNGKGFESYAGVRPSMNQCTWCNGEGYIYPKEKTPAQIRARNTWKGRR